MFQTPSDKSERVVFQIGTANSNDAILGAQVVCNDVKAIDVNMGCPVLFSTQGGMGSALLNKPEVVSDIIRTLKRNLTVPITAKIRIRRNISESVDFVKMLCDEGVSWYVLKICVSFNQVLQFMHDIYLTDHVGGQCLKKFHCFQK